MRAGLALSNISGDDENAKRFNHQIHLEDSFTTRHASTQDQIPFVQLYIKGYIHAARSSIFINTISEINL